jgi:DNA 3'-phosphatase
MWKEIDSVAFYISQNYEYHPTVAVFSFYNTLVKLVQTKNKNTIIDLWCSSVLLKIQTLVEKNVSIIIIDETHYSIVKLKEHIDSFIKLTNIPIIAFFATKKNKYHKPYTESWRLINLLYRKSPNIINASKSVYIGHNAGRMYKNRWVNDKSCCDRAFASNIGLAFTTPERFFLDLDESKKWRGDVNIISERLRRQFYDDSQHYEIPVIIDEIRKLPESSKYTVIITGPPSSGKTTFTQKIFRKWCSDYMEIGSVALTTNPDLIEPILREKKSVIIDITCDAIAITNIIKTSMECETPILLVCMKLSKELNILLDNIKVQIAKDHMVEQQPLHIWKNYTKLYELPVYDLPCVRQIDMPIMINSIPEYWLSYVLF